MFRFLSGRKPRGTSANGTSDAKINKNLIQCRVILLDGTDLTVELSVSLTAMKSIGKPICCGCLLFLTLCSFTGCLDNGHFDDKRISKHLFGFQECSYNPKN